MGEKTRIRKGDRIRDLKWGGKSTGTVVRTMTRSHRRWVFVQWDDTAVEDQLLDYEVEGDIPPVFLTVTKTEGPA